MASQPGESERVENAATRQLSLSQLLLAPLDAIFKAQVHAARSFLNMLLQLAYPDRLRRQDGKIVEEQSEVEMYAQTFTYAGTGPDGESLKQSLSIPVLALVPVRPLAVHEATFKFDFEVEGVADHRQLRKNAGEQEGRVEARPWFLVDDPVSVRGVLAAKGEKGTRSVISVEMRVGSVALPSGLDKLLTSMSSQVRVKPPMEPPAVTIVQPDKKSPS